MGNVVGTSVAGKGGLRALQAASIIMGLPYTFVLFWFAQALVQVAREEGGDLNVERPRMAKSIFDFPTGPRLVSLVKNTFVPGFSPAVKAACSTWPFGGIAGGILWAIVLQTLYLMVVVFLFVGLASVEWVYIAGACYVGFAGWLSLVRRAIRVRCGIPRGDFFTDFFCALFMPMFTLVQLETELDKKESKLVEAPDKAVPAQTIGESAA